MTEVTLSWSVKNFVTVNLMVLAGSAVLVVLVQTVKRAKQKAQS